MFGSTVLDVAAGLVLIYLALALVCTSVNEYIAQVLSLRAEVLYDAVKALFQNSSVAKQFADELYDHDLVTALSPAVAGAKPSYIPSHIFSLAVLDRLGIPVGRGPQGAVVQDIAGRLDAAAKDSTRVADDEIARTLKPLATAAGDDVDQFRKNIEMWFDASMERASGWYKRKVQAIIFWIAIAVALIANADSMMVVDTLWKNPGARAALATQAMSQARNGTSTALLGNAQDLVGLIGWSGPVLPNMHGYDHTHRDPHRFPDGMGEWLGKLVGIMITAFAAALGAPFWFGVLNKIINIRSSGSSPTDKPRSPEAKPQPHDRIPSQGGQ